MFYSLSGSGQITYTGMYPSPPVRGSGERCKLPQWGLWRPGHWGRNKRIHKTATKTRTFIAPNYDNDPCRQSHMSLVTSADTGVCIVWSPKHWPKFLATRPGVSCHHPPPFGTELGFYVPLVTKHVILTAVESTWATSGYTTASSANSTSATRSWKWRQAFAIRTRTTAYNYFHVQRRKQAATLQSYRKHSKARKTGTSHSIHTD